MARKGITDALVILRRQFVNFDPEMRELLKSAREKSEVALQIYKLRTRANLTQKELARKVGTTASAISRLEDADYVGHSLNMLRRIAQVLGQRLSVRFVDETPIGEARAIRRRSRPTRNGRKIKSVEHAT